MDRKTAWIAGGALVFAVVGGGASIAIATGSDDGAGEDAGPAED